MAKAHQDQVGWPYSASQYYPQPRPYTLPSYPQGRVCQESCCRRMRGPISYPHHLPPFPPPSLPCRPPQNNTFVRPQTSPQMRGFLPVNPYMHPQTHGGHSQPPPPPGLHRPIPQGRYDYSDFYRYGNGVNLSSNNSAINNCGTNGNHQGLQHGILKQNSNTYGSCNTVLLPDQYPACSHYPSQEQEPTVPSLDVRQFLATWQDKDEEVFESDPQQKSKGQFQEHPQNIDNFKPLDCTKRNDPPMSMYGYNHDQMAPHMNYYNKGLQSLPNHQPLNEAAFKNSSYMTGNSFHSLPVETDCSYNPRPVALSESQHAGYERRIEKIFNPHRCNVLPDEQNHCVVEKSEVNVKAQTSNDKSHYHLSASLECEDLFDDINKRKEDRQRNVVHPLCYQENFSQSSNESTRKKPDIPHVSVKPNTTIVDYSQNSYEAHNTVNTENEGKALKAPPLKKWMQKQKKSDEELFSGFNMTNQTMDFCGRENTIQQAQILPPSVPGLTLNINSNMATGINNVFPEVSLEDNFQNYGTTINEPEKVAIECIYSSNTFVEPEMQVDGLTAVNGCLPNSSAKSIEPCGEASNVGCDATTISSSCSVPLQEEHKNYKVAHSQCSPLNNNQNVDSNVQTPKGFEKPSCETTMDFSSAIQENQSLELNSNEVMEGEIENRLKEVVEDTPITTNNWSEPQCDNESTSETCLVTSYDDKNPMVKSLEAKLKRYSGHMRQSTFRRKRAFSLLTFWRNRNRLFPKSMSMKKAFPSNKPKCQVVHRYCETSLAHSTRKRKSVVNPSNICESDSPPIDRDQELDVNVVLTSLVDGVCQIGEVSSQVDDISATTDSEQLLHSSSMNEKSEIRQIDGNSNVVGWKTTPGDEKVSSTVESDVTEEDDSNLVLSDDFIKYTEGSDTEGSSDRVLHGILNWPHSEEEITSNNEKESIKVSLPWVKIFETHFKLPDDEKTLDIGPARIELRYSPAPVEYQPGHYSVSKNSTEKKSSIFSVKKVLLKHNRGSSVERIPKMVIKKTGCEEYKSYIKDAKLRVVSIKNSNKDGKAEVIIEADRPLIESLRDSEVIQGVSECSRKAESPGMIQSSEVDAECKSSEGTSETAKELHHCLLCQESFTSLDKLHNHENSLSHRHIDIVQRNVLHKLQKSTSGNVPSFQPLSATEIEYLNWRPNFPGYNHFYHNVPL